MFNGTCIGIAMKMPYRKTNEIIFFITTYITLLFKENSISYKNKNRNSYIFLND